MLSHVDDNRQPAMVDVSEKSVTRRSALARAIVLFPTETAGKLREAGMSTNKGPVFQTAIVAGVMAAKKTHELVPFCHPLALEDCNIQIEMVEDEARIECRVTLHGRTGAEMEALTGASVAALTVYDMCKSLSHKIVIREVRLVEKKGGKSDVEVTSEQGNE